MGCYSLLVSVLFVLSIVIPRSVATIALAAVTSEVSCWKFSIQASMVYPST